MKALKLVLGRPSSGQMTAVGRTRVLLTVKRNGNGNETVYVYPDGRPRGKLAHILVVATEPVIHRARYLIGDNIFMTAVSKSGTIALVLDPFVDAPDGKDLPYYAVGCDVQATGSYTVVFHFEDEMGGTLEGTLRNGNTWRISPGPCDARFDSQIGTLRALDYCDILEESKTTKEGDSISNVCV